MDQFFEELKKLLDSLPQQSKEEPSLGNDPEELITEFKKLIASIPNMTTPEAIKEIQDAYKQYGFDHKNPPTDNELATWATQLIYQWYYTPSVNVNLPLTGLILAYNMTTWMKLDQLDQANLKTLLMTVFNMGYAMGLYKMRSPFDKKPQPQETN